MLRLHVLAQYLQLLDRLAQREIGGRDIGNKCHHHSPELLLGCHEEHLLCLRAHVDAAEHVGLPLH